MCVFVIFYQYIPFFPTDARSRNSTNNFFTHFYSFYIPSSSSSHLQRDGACLPATFVHNDVGIDDKVCISVHKNLLEVFAARTNKYSFIQIITKPNSNTNHSKNLNRNTYIHNLYLGLNTTKHFIPMQIYWILPFSTSLLSNSTNSLNCL